MQLDSLIVLEIVSGRVRIVDWVVILIVHLLHNVYRDGETGDNADEAANQRPVCLLPLLG